MANVFRYHWVTAVSVNQKKREREAKMNIAEWSQPGNHRCQWGWDRTRRETVCAVCQTVATDGAFA